MLFRFISYFSISSIQFIIYRRIIINLIIASGTICLNEHFYTSIFSNIYLYSQCFTSRDNVWHLPFFVTTNFWISNTNVFLFFFFQTELVIKIYLYVPDRKNFRNVIRYTKYANMHNRAVAARRILLYKCTLCGDVWNL